MATLDILIPHYNDIDGLELTLRSIAAQTWRGETRIVIVDDGSAPDSARAAREIGEAFSQPVTFIANARNRGRPYTRNVLLDAIDSPYVAWLDAGERQLFLTGDNLVSDLVYNAGADGLAFAVNVMGVNNYAADLRYFIANQSTHSNGGAMRIQEVNVTVINTEFVDNVAATVGAGIHGRADVYASTFTGNVALSGSAIYAPDGPTMLFRHSVAFPDTVWGNNINHAWSCNSPGSGSGAPHVTINSPSPFAPADLDEDGYDEWYLVPGHGCSGLVNGVLDVIDWEVMTTFQSQCTDSGWPDPGVHYQPLSAVGACE